jgi:hypothetical protein
MELHEVAHYSLGNSTDCRFACPLHLACLVGLVFFSVGDICSGKYLPVGISGVGDFPGHSTFGEVISE